MGDGGYGGGRLSPCAPSNPICALVVDEGEHGARMDEPGTTTMNANTPNPRDYARLWASWCDHGKACPVCGLTYVRELESDRRLHRARHRKVLQVYEPKPVPLLETLHAQYGEFVPVNEQSPRSLRNRLEGMATMFQRELGFDFSPYSADDDRSEPVHHWLIVAADGRAIGGLSARWCVYSDAPAQWMWTWAWVIPSERRAGYTQRCWTMLRAAIQRIEPEPPFSYPVAKFFAEREDVSERIRVIAARRIAHGIDDADE
jgi:zinc-finger of acetyl-transferase ESCO